MLNVKRVLKMYIEALCVSLWIGHRMMCSVVSSHDFIASFVILDVFLKALASGVM